MFPSKWRFEDLRSSESEHLDGSQGAAAPKVLVLIADPRYAMMLWWECACYITQRDIPRPAFLEAVLEKRFQIFGDYFSHALAWARTAAEHPDNVRLFSADRLASWDPKEVRAALAEIGEFLEVEAPGQTADRLASRTFTRPADAAHSLAYDQLPPREAILGGPLVEHLGQRLHGFQETLADMGFQAQDAWAKQLLSWKDSSDPFLERLGTRASFGVASLPPARLARPQKGEAAHAAGECRPCVFALRGVCKETPEMCAYCHLPGHQPTKRASRGTRARRRHRERTPSLDGLST